jgi:hypothetical protein
MSASVNALLSAWATSRALMRNATATTSAGRLSTKVDNSALAKSRNSLRDYLGQVSLLHEGLGTRGTPPQPQACCEA